MNRLEEIELLTEGLHVRTKGLATLGHSELTVQVSTPALLTESEAFLHFIVNYVVEQGAQLGPDETLAYGYWLTQFRAQGPNLMEVWEYNSDATQFVLGATLTLTYWRDQHEICRRYGADFSPPRPDNLVVISAGVMEGNPVQGVRYPSPEHMSGWWITTDQYNGDITSLRQEHLYHLTSVRPDLARYIALPSGYRFDLAGGEDVWFEQKVADQPVS